MSLLQRVERAHQGPEVPNPDAIVPVAPPAPPKPEPGQAREEFLRGVRVRLQGEVIGAFNSLRETTGPADTRSKLEGIVDRVINAHGFVVTRDERVRLVQEMADDFTGFGPIEPFLRDETITEVMVNGPTHIYIERAGKIVARQPALPERRARAPDHRPDHHPARAAHRRRPARGWTPACPTARASTRSSSRSR